MTSNNARSVRTASPSKHGVRLAGIALGLVAAIGSLQAAPQAAAPAAVAPMPSSGPGKQLPGTVAVSAIDFKRGEDGSGRLIVRFSGDGATPDLRKTGASVVVDVGNAQLPAELRRTLDVSDFATPVRRIDPRSAGTGTQLVLDTSGAFDSMAYQTGREYIVEITPKAASSSSRAMGATASVQAAASQVIAANGSTRYTGKPVTFNFQDVPVRTVLQLIAEESGLNVVAADTVTGNVTLRLINVPWDQALDIVLQAKALDKRRSGNVVWVAPQAEIAKYEQDREDARIAIDNRVDLVTEYVQINYHNAEAIYKALTEAKGIGGAGGAGAQGAGAGSSQTGDTGFLSPRGRLVADARTNTLMISDIPKKVTQMKELIRVIDRPVDQVVIEARVVIATDTFARELGAKFGISGASGAPGDRSSLGFGGNADASSANALARSNAVQNGARGFTATRALMTNLPAANAAGAIGLSILNAGYLLDVELSALQAEGRGEVISNPRVVTSNQREAVITQGQEVGYVTIQAAQPGQVPTPSVQFKDVVLQMRVTPTITNDGRVFLNMAVKKDEIAGFVDTSIGDVPQISKREVNTAVLVEDGQTVVIGGVYEFSNREDVTKVPFLADIPFLGNLFKKRGKTNNKAELLIFVTPKVLHVAQR
ncbi:type IV pilus secretin PilQ [Lysobacter humi (ex Lee et al. 2017)]